MSLGERFRAAREQRGLSLSEVAEHLRIRSVYLAAIEEENWSAIGAPVYTRGFLRTYARYLGLDPEEAVGAFNSASGQPPPAAIPSRQIDSSPYREPRSLRPVLWIAGIVAVGLIAFVIYLYLAPPRTAGLTAMSTAATASPQSAGTATPVSTPTFLPQVKTLAILLTAPCWLRVVVDGSVSIEGTFPAGTRKTFHGKTALVRVGNAGGVQITVDGRPVGRLGSSGDVVERSFTL